MLLALEPRTFLSVAPPAGPQIVDSTGDVGQYTSIALDSTGSPGISYFDKTNDSLKFAQWEGDHWNNQTVVAGLGGPPVGQGTSLQFDAANHAIIAYYNQGNKDLQLASWTGTKWSIQTVDSVGDVGRYPSLALDSAGNPQISYFGKGNLKFARRVAGAWHVETAFDDSNPSTNDVGKFTSLKLDAGDNPHIGFFNDFTLSYATRATPSSAWSIQSADTGDGYDEEGYGASLALDSSGVPRLSHIGGGRAGIYGARYAVPDNAGGWSSKPISSFDLSLPQDGNVTSIVLDRSENPIVAFSDGSRLILSVSRDGGTTFQDQAIDDNHSTIHGELTGLYNSMAIGNDGTLHVSYYDERAGNLKYWSGEPLGAFLEGTVNDLAYGPDGTLHLAFYGQRRLGGPLYASRAPDGIWSATERVDLNLPSDQKYLSIAADASGRPGIAYYDGVNGDLKYASRNASGSWEVQVVDTQRTTGLYPSLVFGTNGRPVISYYYATRGELRLAARGRGGWSIQTIDAANDAGRFSSLAADPLSGRWDVGYVTEENGGRAKIQLARQTRNGWAAQAVDRLPGDGGFVSLAFAPSGLPALSYYNAQKADLKFADFDGKRWHPTTVASSRSQGRYCNLLYQNSDPVIVYYNRTNDTLNRARRGTSGKWAFAAPLPGGRYTSAVARLGGGYSYSRLDPDTENLLIEDGS